MTDELHVPGIARRFVGFIERRPWVTLLLSVGFLAALTPGMGRLKADFTYRAFFHDDDELVLRFDRFERQFGNDDAVVVAVHSPSGVFDLESAQLLMELTEKMWKIPDVIRVESLSNFNWVHGEEDDIIVEPLFPDDVPLTQEILDERRAIALRHETLPDYLVSRDGNTAMLFAFIIPGIDAPPDNPKIVHPVRDLLAELQRGDHTFYLTGGPPLSLAFQEAATHDMSTLVPVVLGVTVLLLIILLRSIAGLVLPLVVVGLSIVGSLSFAGWIGVDLTNVTTSLPQILIAIGIADSVHILVTFYRAMKRGLERQDAARYSLLKNFIPTILTSLTTAIGFLSFATADLKPVAGLGMLAGFGALIAWFLTYGVLGSTLFALPLRANRLSSETIRRGDAMMGRVTVLLRKYRIAIIGSFAALSVVALALTLQNEVNSDPFKYFAEGYPVRAANEFVEETVGGARGVELVINSGSEEGIKDPAFLAKVDEFQKWIDAQPGVTRSVSIVDILKQTHRSLHGGDDAFYRLPDNKEMVGQELFLYTMGLPQGMDINNRVTIKNDSIRVTALWTIPTSAESVEMVEAIEKKGASMGLDVHATGKNLLWQSMNGYVVDTFVVSMSAAIFLISVLLIIFFRSIGLGLLAMIPNATPLIAGGAVLFLMGKTLDVGTVLVGAVCLGIAVDDTIHILSNYLRLRIEGKSARDAVHAVLNDTAPALVTTTLVLVTAFGTFIFADFTPNMSFGLLTAIILTVALITDVTLLPAILLRKEGAGAEVEEADASAA